MRPWTRWIAGAGLAVAMTGGIAAAAGVGDGDQALTGTVRDRAVAAALAASGGRTVVESEVGEGGAAYAVEVRLRVGRRVEFNLDRSFRVVAREPDEDQPRQDQPRQDRPGEDRPREDRPREDRPREDGTR